MNNSNKYYTHVLIIISAYYNDYKKGKTRKCNNIYRG